MKQINKVTVADWEQANLDKLAAEIFVADRDFDTNLRDLGRLIADFEYVVARVPFGNPEGLNAVHESKFRFCEVQLRLACSFDKLLEESEDRANAFRAKARLEKVANWGQLGTLLELIEPGMFLTDRVSLDPCLGQDLAARRYRNWISTEFEQGHSEICFIESNGKLVGFAMVRTEGGHLDYLLGGIFPAFMKMGFGPQIVVQPLELARQLGLKGMSTSVSSNNTSVAAIYAHFGFDVKIPESKYIFSYLR